MGYFERSPVVLNVFTANASKIHSAISGKQFCWQTRLVCVVLVLFFQQMWKSWINLERLILPECHVSLCPSLSLSKTLSASGHKTLNTTKCCRVTEEGDISLKKSKSQIPSCCFIRLSTSPPSPPPTFATSWLPLGEETGPSQEANRVLKDSPLPPPLAPQLRSGWNSLCRWITSRPALPSPTPGVNSS